MPARPRLDSPFVTVALAAALVALWALRDVLMLVGFAALFAFALDPAVSLLQRLRVRGGGLPRAAAAAVVMALLAALGAWALVVAVPQLVRELGGFVSGAPASLERLLAAVHEQAAARGLSGVLGSLPAPEDSASLIERWGLALLRLVAGRLGDLGDLVGLALVPILAFYLLSEREAVEHSALGFVPEDARPRARQVLAAVDRALRSYVRGQSVVCLTIGIAVGLALAMLGFPIAALLGTTAAVAEVVPILGFWIASIAIVLAGWGVSPVHAGLGFAAYLVLNQLVGLFLTPRVMGRHMKMHPFVVTVSILAGGTLLGAAGAVLALPLAAAIQSVVSEFTGRRRQS
jgi:predicted PurR-regulated permease PerM